MSVTSRYILIVNTGSSSIKLSVFSSRPTAPKLERILDIAANDIGQPSASITYAPHSEPPSTEEVDAPNHRAAIRLLIKQLAQVISPTDSILSIGHRLVHGGSKFAAPTPIANIAAADWDELSQLDPQHTPTARQIIALLAEIFPHVPQIACFDTAFFHDLPPAAQILPIPQKYYTQGLRKYGFHGISYTSLLSSFRDLAGETAMNGRVILAHLGSGASLAATYNGQPIDTTMSLTPASGVPMSVRSGDLDPNLFSYLHHQNGMSIESFDRMSNFESGLLGISDRTGNMRTLLGLEAEDKYAALAVEVFVHNVKKAIGSLSAVLGGLDSLIFSGGIGERSSILRGRICQDLGYMGISINENANNQHAFLISAADSRVGVHIIPSDEARVIAKQIYELQTREEG